MDGGLKEADPVLQVHTESAGGSCYERFSESLGGRFEKSINWYQHEKFRQIL